MTAEEVRQAVIEATRLFASKEGKTRAENIAMTHLDTAVLWLDAQARADKMSKGYEKK